MILQSSLMLLVVGVTVVACVTAVVCIQTVAGILAVAGGSAVNGFPTVDIVLAVASFPADPGVPILAGGFVD
jgi:hypothetical protein